MGLFFFRQIALEKNDASLAQLLTLRFNPKVGTLSSQERPSALSAVSSSSSSSLACFDQAFKGFQKNISGSPLQGIGTREQSWISSTWVGMPPQVILSLFQQFSFQ